MSEATTKRSPGRPKAAAPKPAASKKRTIKREEKVINHAEYEILSGGGVVFMLPQKGVTVYDKEKDTVREMRYCPNEPSIWRDEQSDNAVKESVIFERGRVFVPKSKPNLRFFMDKHPGNKANGGSIFKQIDKRKDATEELNREFKLTEAITLVRDTDITDLLPIAIYFKVNINTPVTEIRYNLLQIAKRKPKEFIESFDSPQVQTRAIIQQAKDYQIINLKTDGAFWFDSNSLIVSVPAGQEPMDVMVRYCLTERGAPVLSDIEERLDKLA